VRAVRGVTTAESERIGARGHPLYYLSIHDIDAARWCVGTDVEQVTAVERRGELEHLDVPDATNVTLTFTDGTVATVAGYGVLPADTPGGITAGFELVGTRGTASVDTPGTTLAVTGPAGHDRPDVRHWPVINGRMDGAVRRQVDALAAAVAGEGELLASLRDGARAQTVADAALAAFDSETPVAVDSR
jgi:predicted dehydrogenase